MQKTTLYIEDELLKKLKGVAAHADSRVTVSDLIRQAVRLFVDHALPKDESFPFLKKTLKRKSKVTSFGNPISYQRRSREEWE